MLTILTTEITQILDQTMAKVTEQFPITEIPADEASIIKAVKDALKPAKAEAAEGVEAPAEQKASKPAAIKATSGK